MDPIHIPFASLIKQCRVALQRERSGLLYHLGLKPGPGAGGAGVTEQLQPHYRILATKGRVVWGSIAQVNRMMFLEGDEDLPGVTVYSPDPYYDAMPQDLMVMASACYQFKNYAPADEQYRPITERLTNEFDSTARLALPLSLTDERTVFLGATLFHRPRLPGGVLRANLFPMVIAPTLTEFNMVLPLKCWPADLCDIWRELQQQLKAQPTQSRAFEVASVAEKWPIDRTKRHWDIEELPIWITPVMAMQMDAYIRQGGLAHEPFLLVRLEDNGDRFVDVAEHYNPTTQVLFRSNGVQVIVFKKQLEKLRGAIIDFQTEGLSAGVIIRLLGE